ncbi:TPA: ead/Ea22-like family protein [Escherichia coli]
MSNIDKRALRHSAESIICILENIAGFEPSDIDGDSVELRFETEDGFDTGCDVSIVDQCQKTADVVRALLDELERNQQYIKSRDQENEDIALTVGKLRVELEGKDKLIAELGKQCAEWERKALSNFEECAAMAERIEEMSKQSCEARERDLFESWVMHSICISKSTLEGLRTETGYRNATLSGTDFNRMWKQWKSIRATGIRIKGE